MSLSVDPAIATDGAAAAEGSASDEATMPDAVASGGTETAPSAPATVPAVTPRVSPGVLAPSRGSDTGSAAETAGADRTPTETAPTPSAGTPEGRPSGSPGTEVLSDAVVRFTLAESVLNREPRRPLAAADVKGTGLRSLSVFSDVAGLEGETLTYRWFHDGRQVLSIRVPVGAQRWRSHSTKAIHASGSWRVELVDSKGTVLARADFER
jgi:hypothetical protein